MDGTSSRSVGFRILLTLAVIGSTAVIVAPAISMILKQDNSFAGEFHRSLVDSDSDSDGDNYSDEQDSALEESSFLSRPLFPMRTVDYVGFVAAILGLIMAAGGGLGGGGFLVPIYILIMGFPVKPAVSLSIVTVLGGAIANILLNFPKRHPSSVVDRPLIDWNFMAMMEPSAMAGALFGADLNEFLPDIVLVIMLVLLLGFTTMRTLEKANKMHALESKSGEDSTTTAPAAKEDEQALLEAAVKSPGSSSSSKVLSYGTQGASNLENNKGADSISLELARLIEKESKVPWLRIAELSGLFLAVIGLNLLQGSGDHLAWLLPFEVTCGTLTYYLLGKLNLVVIVGFALYMRQNLTRDTAHKRALEYVFSPGDILWDGRNTLVYSSMFFLAGLFAGLFGIGGGMVKSPLMLEMGLHPAVTSATSATMILFTSFTAATSFIVHGELNYQYAIMCVVLGFVSTVVGQILMDVLLAKYNRHSYIAYCIALVVGVSAVFMTVESVLALAKGNSRQGTDMCSSVH